MNERTRHTNRSPSRSSLGPTILVTAGVKAICGAVLAVMVMTVWQQFSDLDKRQELLVPWAKVQNYAIFYPRLIGDDRQELETGGNTSSVTEARDLYPVLEEAGGIFIDSANYEPGVSPPPASPWPAAPILVNTNYLKQYPIMDDSRKPIVVGDDEQAWVVAVPEQFKAREAQIRQLLQTTRTGGQGITGAVQAESKITGTPAPDRFNNQEIRIIWMASGQEVFSFNPKVNPDHGNMITDPVVQVMTPQNSLVVDRLNSVTGGLNTGLKVRVDGDPAAVLAKLTPLLKQLKLDDNLAHLVTFHEALGTQVSEVRSALTQVTAFAGGALIVMIMLNATIVIIGSDRLRRKLTVRRLHGIGFTRSYRELILVLSGTWLVQTFLAGVGVVLLGMNTMATPGLEVSPFAQVPNLVAVAIASLVIEGVLVVVTARVVERRNTVKRLKEL